MDSRNTAEERQGRLFYGWYIVAVAFLCYFVADAFGWYTYGIFMGPVTSELGWSTTAFTFALTLRTIVAGGLGPFIGPIIDTKYGARVLMTMGVLVAGAVPLLVSRIHSLWMFYFFYGVIGALGMVGFGGLVTNALIAKWFIRMRGRAIGISALGVSISGLVFIQVVHRLISAVGWRTTLVVIGFIIWAVALVPVIIFVRRRPEDMGLLPDGAASRHDRITPEEIAALDLTDVEVSWTVGQAFRTKAMWLLLIGFTLVGISLGGVFVHYFPYLESVGYSKNIAANAMTFLALCCALVKVPWGILSERVNIRHCMVVCYGGSAISLIILLLSTNLFTAYLYVVAYGFTLGGDMVIREVAYANYFGRHFLGTIKGVIMPINLISFAGGPLLAAWLKDITGSYRLAFQFFFILAVLGTIVLYFAKPPQKKA